MDNGARISLIDKTRPTSDLGAELCESTGPSRHFSRRLGRRGKYAKWQPKERDAENRPSSDTPEVCQGPSKGPALHVDPADSATSDQGNASGNGYRNGDSNDSSDQADQIKPIKEIDVLYENQRGVFLFGVPLYSCRSLLNLDPGPWVTGELKDSPVDITNAQVPDPSWQWAWHTWYVDMSGDVDEHGWQYSWSFSSSAWHGNHPWFHSLVRRRRWVRLRVKKDSKTVRRGRSRFDKAHMLTADYFTIHSSKGKTIAVSVTQSSRLSSNYLSRASTKVDEGVAGLEEIADIPTLMYAFKVAIVDREKMEALKRFIWDGGDELYYLDQRIPEFMDKFVFQTSRWQFVTYLTGVVDELSQKVPDSEEIQRKYDNLAKAAETARHHIRGPDLFGNGNRASATDMLDLSPESNRNGLLSQYFGKPVEDINRPGKIRGVPKAAEIGREGHIY